MTVSNTSIDSDNGATPFVSHRCMLFCGKECQIQERTAYNNRQQAMRAQYEAQNKDLAQ